MEQARNPRLSDGSDMTEQVEYFPRHDLLLAAVIIHILSQHDWWLEHQHSLVDQS